MDVLAKVWQAQQRALMRLWRDRCTIIAWQKVKDPVSKLTDFQEVELATAEPCLLSFEKLEPAAGGDVSAKAQGVKLFLSAAVQIPAGCKIVVHRLTAPEREFIFAASGEAAVYASHQEVYLSLWKGWA